MKHAILAVFLFAASLWGQYTPPPAAAFTYSAGSWVAAATSATSGAISYTPPAAALYCYNSSLGKWVPADSSCFGGSSIPYPGAGIPNSTGSAWGTSYTQGIGAGNIPAVGSGGSLAVSSFLATDGAGGLTSTLPYTPANSAATANYYAIGTGSGTLGNGTIDHGVSTAGYDTNSYNIAAPILAATAPCSYASATGGCVPINQGTAPSAGASGADALYATTSGIGETNGTSVLGLLLYAGGPGGTPSAINLSNGTNLPASALPAASRTLPCQVGIDGLGTEITAATYTLKARCLNIFGVTYTITGVQCYADNAGISTANVADSGTNALLTGAITLSGTANTWQAGTQSSTTTIASGVWTVWTIVADGTSKVIQCVMTTTH